jgi:hypothetical protein
MLYDLSAVVPLVVVIALLALVGSVVSVAVVAEATVRHRRTRVARHESIPTYYRRLLAAH